MQEVQAPGADSNSQDNTCVLSSFSALNQKQPGEMGTGNLDLSLSTCVPAVCAAWCCLVPLLQWQYRAAEQRVSPHLPTCPFCSPGMPVQGCDSSPGPRSLQVWLRGARVQDVPASP